MTLSAAAVYVVAMLALRWWAPVGTGAVALAFGLLPYAALTATATISPGLRDNPWPLEIVAVLATGITLGLAIRAYRQRRARAVATVCAALATLSTGVFLALLHVGSYGLPPPPKELAIGRPAPAFELPDESGGKVTLASLQGHPSLLVFYRGAW